MTGPAVAAWLLELAHARLLVAGWLVAALMLVAAALLYRELRRRAELVARACHELRGPLTAARLGVHLLARPGTPGAPRAEAVDLELRRAALALDDLQAARSGARAADSTTAVEVGALLRQVATAWRPVADAAGVALRCQPPAGPTMVRGDRVRLAQACGNLVANALEHGAGDVELRARSAVGQVRVEVLDAGPGLPAPVAQLARRPRAGRGARGRGLAIAAEIARRHDGRLAAAPSARGARLALELPLARPASARGGPADRRRSGA